MSRASPVKQAIPANLGGSPLIESGNLRGQDVSFNNRLAVTRRRTSYALQEEKPRLISAQEIAQLSTLCTRYCPFIILHQEITYTWWRTVINSPTHFDKEQIKLLPQSGRVMQVKGLRVFSM